MSEIVIGIENLNLKIENNILFSNFSINVLKEERVGITGPSGCGKSTLLKSIIKNKFPNGSTFSKLHKSTIASFSFIPQSNGLLPWYSLQRNLNIFKKNLTLYEDTIKKFNINCCINNFPHQLSGGEYQRALLAEGIINQPDIYLADEPLTELDITKKWELLSYWSTKIKDDNATLILVAHDLDTLLYLCDRIIVLSDKPCKIIKEFDIPQPHPRQLDFLVSGEFIHSKKLLLESIKSQ